MTGRGAFGCAAIGLLVTAGPACKPGAYVVVSPPPPFSIPNAPVAGTLQLCDANAPPFPLGFLADGRVLVAQVASSTTLVRAWDPKAGQLENLFEASDRLFFDPYGKKVHVSRDGKRIFETREETFRVYDLDQRGFLPEPPGPVSVAAVSASGQFVLDDHLRRYTALGEMDFDFGPLIPADFRPLPFLKGLSFAGDAILVMGNVRTSADGWAPTALVIHQDGRVVALPQRPMFEICSVSCGVAWSADDRHVLAFDEGTLRVWEAETGTTTASLEEPIFAAAFLPDGEAVVVAGEGGAVLELDLTGQIRVSRPGMSPFALGLDGRMAARTTGTASGLVVTAGDRVEGRWETLPGGWLGGRAVSGDSIFAMVSDGGPVNSAVTLARFVIGQANPSAVFPSGESESEWEGAVVLSPDEDRVAAVFPDTIAILEARALTPIVRLPTGSGPIAWSPDGRHLATTPDLHYRVDPSRPAYTPGRAVRVWDASSGRMVARFDIPVFAQNVAFDETGARLVVWGHPKVSAMRSGGSDAFTIVTYQVDGAPASFEIDLTNGVWSPSDLPPFVGATRGLVATADSIVRISTGQRVSSLPPPSVAKATFSGDFSLVLAASEEDFSFRLFGVSDGHLVAAGEAQGLRMPLALSRDGRRVVLNHTVHCLADNR